MTRLRWLAFAGLSLLSLAFLLRRGTARSRLRASGRLRRLSGHAGDSGTNAARAPEGRAAAQWLAGRRFARRLEGPFLESGVRIPYQSFLSLWLWSLPFAAAASVAVSGSVLLVGPAVAVALAAPLPVLKALARRRRRIEAGLCEQLASGVALHLACGMPVQDAVRLCAPDAGDGLSGALEHFFTALSMGAGAEDAFMGLAQGLDSPDLDLIARAAMTSRETGSDVRAVMGAVGEALRDRSAIRRDLHTQTAQGRLSGQVVAGLPLLFLGLSLLVSRESLSVLLGTAPGLMMVGAAAVLDVLGFLWIRKILDMSGR